MNTPTPTMATELPRQIAVWIINMIEESTKEAARMIWTFAMSFLAEHWLVVMGGFLGLLFFLIILAILGDWGGLYSLTYWTLYACLVFVAGLIWGPEVLVGDIFHIVYMAAIWPLCYFFTGWIWDRFGFRRRNLN